MKKIVFLLSLMTVVVLFSCKKDKTGPVVPPAQAIIDTIMVNNNPETPASDSLAPGQTNVRVMTLNITPKCDCKLTSLSTIIMPTGTPVLGYTDLSSLGIFNGTVQVGSFMPVVASTAEHTNLDVQLKKGVNYILTSVINVSSSAVPGSLFQLSFGGLTATDANGNAVSWWRGGTIGNIFTIKK